MSDLLEETKSDYIEVKKLEYFKKSIPFIIIGTILVITAMILSNWLRDRKIANDQKMGDLFIKAVESGDKALLSESLSFIIKDNSTGVSDIARLVLIQNHMDDKDDTKLLSELKAIVIDSKNSLTKSYGMLMLMNIMIDKNDLSESETKDMEQYIKHFNDPNMPFFGSASIINALYKIKHNDIEGAKIILRNLITTKDMSRVVQDEANSILSNL